MLKTRFHFYYIHILFLFFGTSNLAAQFKANPHFGFNAGMVINIGTHINTFGAVAHFYYSDYFYQLNFNTQFKFNFNSYGNRRMFWENRNAIGAVLLAGKQQMTPDFQLDGLNHQTKFNYGIAYNYLFYFDEAKTSQRSGAWAVHLKQLTLAHENDVFGGQAKDRFRTATLHFSYRYDQWKFFSTVFLWTGETRNSIWDKTARPGIPNGYRDLSANSYGKTSHGIWNFGVTRHLTFNQTIGAKIGYDSEQIRHIVQNKFGHDLPFMPKSFPRTTPHYPRLDEIGMPTFNRQNMRKNRLYLQFNMNEVYSN